MSGIVHGPVIHRKLLTTFPHPPPNRVDFDKDCEDPEYKPVGGPPKEPDDEVRA